MKAAIGLILTLAVAASAQDPTVTEGLLAAQADLALTHHFFEQTIFLSRNQVSSYLYRINRDIIDSHINTYGLVKNIGLDTLAEIDEFETNEEERTCIDNILERWNLQKLRYGHRLASCVANVHRVLTDKNDAINSLHALGMETGNQVQNLGLKVLSETEIFDGRNSIPALVNRELRILLSRAYPYSERFDDFLENLSGEILDTIRELISCDEVLEEDFQREVERDVQRARNCVGLENPNPEQTPAPLSL